MGPATRRRFLVSALPAGGTILTATRPARSAAQASTASPAERQRFMARAFEMRQLAITRGDQAFGAVVVRNNQVVGEGVSAVLTSPDPTAHGEIQALRDAARRLGTARLAGCDLYTTFRPCPMCETAAYWAGIERVYFGETITDAGAPRYPRC